jgi:hypothetical protein
MSIVLDGTTGITSPAFDGAIDATDLTGDVAAARITSALNATGSAPMYACRAWVNFNGTGTVAIRASGNVSSITDNGVGEYTINFTTAMPDANYSAQINSDHGNTTGISSVIAFNTTSVRVYTSLHNVGPVDKSINTVAIVR